MARKGKPQQDLGEGTHLKHDSKQGAQFGKCRINTEYWFFTPLPRIMGEYSELSN
jgi:hypothetical protein